jgi:hypothetical protein
VRTLGEPQALAPLSKGKDRTLWPCYSVSIGLPRAGGADDLLTAASVPTMGISVRTRM